MCALAVYIHTPQSASDVKIYMHTAEMQLKLNKISLSSLFTFSLLISLSLSKTPNTHPDSTALLAFKLSSDSSNSLPWPDPESDSDPCSWLGVTCHASTHRVTKLVLNHLNLTGSTQTLARLTQLRQLSLHHNRLSSAPSLASWPNIKHLYLSHNRFSGEFPAGVSHLHRLLRLDLSYNHFSGKIPLTELTRLPHLITLRLEFNLFSGTLNSTPSSSLLEFDVSGNDLAGKIPDSLSKFPVESFTGNFRLCGKPLSSNCYNRTIHSKPTAGGDSAQIRDGDQKMKKKLRDSVELMIFSVDVAAVIATLAVVTWCCYSRKYKGNKYGVNKVKVGVYNSKIYGGVLKESSSNDEEKMVCFEGCKGFDKVEELLTASAEMLGKGSVGTTYKVVMDGGGVVAVKRVRVRERRNIKKKEIDGFLRDIGGLRNPNILSLRAFSCSTDELLLVYDFLPNGSLYTLLHGNRGPGRTPLDWTTRLNLASGSAQGLAFLHSQKTSKLSHGNLTSSNIIIDHLGNACISDIALNLLLQIPFSPSNTYIAPELTNVQLDDTANNNNIPTRNYSKKCDVYSFGIILLEILTGKTANVEGEGSLASWVRKVMLQEEWSWELFDFELLRHKEMQGQMVALLQVALLCLALSPSDRPEMSTVHKMVDDIRVKGSGEGEGQELNELSSGSCSLSESTSLNFTCN